MPCGIARHPRGVHPSWCLDPAVQQLNGHRSLLPALAERLISPHHNRGFPWCHNSSLSWPRHRNTTVVVPHGTQTSGSPSFDSMHPIDAVMLATKSSVLNIPPQLSRACCPSAALTVGITVSVVLSSKGTNVVVSELSNPRSFQASSSDQGCSKPPPGDHPLCPSRAIRR